MKNNSVTMTWFIMLGFLLATTQLPAMHHTDRMLGEETTAERLPASSETTGTKRLQLIPKPQRVTYSGETVALPSCISISAGFAQEAAALLSGMLSDISGVETQLTTGDTSREGAVMAKEEHGDQVGFIRFIRDESLASEAYRIRTGDSGIRIYAAGDSGALWAVQTVRQLFMQLYLLSPQEHKTMPAVVIEDAPLFAWRGFHLDLARHMFTKAYLKKTIDRLAGYKINKLHLHLNDDQGWRLESAAYPLLTETGGWRTFDKYDSICIRKSADDPTMALDKRFLRDDTLYGGYYTKEDMREIIAHAATYGMEVIPEIDMPGHMSAAIRAYPWLSCSGAAGWGEEFSHPLCTAKPEVRAFAKKVLEEVAELFPSDYLHIGADEVETTIWEECPLCRATMAEQQMSGARDLQTHFVEEMHDYLKSIGKKTVVWDDAAEEEGVSNEMYVTFWRDWKYENAAPIVERGHPMIFATWSHFYLSARPSFDRWKALYQFDITEAYPGMTDDRLMGYQACVWTEEIPGEAKLEEHIFPAIQAFSERVWSSDRDWDDFMGRMPLHYLIMDRESINYSKSR